jgi:hypothetical protein
MLLVQLIPFASAIWLGLFLLRRGAHPRLRFAAYGLLLYAAALITNIPNLALALRLLPPILWVGAVMHLDQRVIDRHPTLLAFWRWALIPVTILLGGFFLLNPSASQAFPFNWISLFLGLTPLFWTIFLLHDFIVFLRPRQATGVLFTATIFFALGEGFLLLPFDTRVQQIVLPAIGFDILLLGFCIAWFDALDEGEAFLPEMLRSFVQTFIVTLIFAGQIGFVIAIQTGLTTTMQLLLISTVLASVVFSVFGDALQSRLDDFAFARVPSVREAKRQMETEAGIWSRKDAGINLKEMNDEERSRFTRRALSHFGDLPRLASNPLTQLPVIEQRLRTRNIPDTTLARAAELKAVLTEAIAKLKPHGEKLFDATDEWRLYNSVYFPYVAGLRPYSRNEKATAPHEQEASRWFQAFVPERTLHNWQNTAAKLIANDLWEHNWQ